MTDTTGLDLAWWITAIDLPALGGLFWLILKVRKDADAALERARAGIDATSVQMREALAAYKLEVAKTYASLGTLREVEQRLTDHLLRIEAKLDGARAAATRATATRATGGAA
ncbi:hypothetical protein [Rhodocista pekingensis]|uniref:Chemotaxis protein n=1 Tax=Rhodocista pekingensis TaxID=201185 RepID=A0ABW2KTJ0_9PROT